MRCRMGAGIPSPSRVEVLVDKAAAVGKVPVGDKVDILLGDIAEDTPHQVVDTDLQVEAGRRWEAAAGPQWFVISACPLLIKS